MEKKAVAETKWIHDDDAARNLAIQASLHPKLSEWSLVLRAASPYCELMRSLAPSNLLVRDHHLDDSIVAVLGDGERTFSQADLLSVEDWAAVHLPPHQNDTMILLSDEVILGDGAADHLVVLYANLGRSSLPQCTNDYCRVEWCDLSCDIGASSKRCNSPLFYKGME